MYASSSTTPIKPLSRSSSVSTNNVDRMSDTAAALVLALSWAVHRHLERRNSRGFSSNGHAVPVPEQEKNEAISSKSGTQNVPLPPAFASILGLSSLHSETESGDSISALLDQTPGDGYPWCWIGDDDSNDLDHIYDLLRTLLEIYLQKKIHSEDPPYFPATYARLPPSGKLENEVKKGGNIWQMGRVVALEVLELELLKEAGESDQTGRAAYVLASYILAITSQGLESESYFLTTASTTPTGLSLPDHLILEANKCIEVSASKYCDPRGAGGLNLFSADGGNIGGSPKGALLASSQNVGGNGGCWNPSSTYVSSSTFSPHRVMQSSKSSTSLASLALPLDPRDENDFSRPRVSVARSSLGDALETLKKLHVKYRAEIRAELETEEYDDEHIIDEPHTRDEEGGPPGIIQRVFALDPDDPHAHIPAIQDIASSPHPPSLSHPRPRPSTITSTYFSPAQAANHLLPPSDPHNISPIDPALAAAELRSALTKHVQCSVCRKSGINFPECRKCGDTFCGRGCRVGEGKGGNGNKHVCGLWESKQMQRFDPELDKDSAPSATLAQQPNEEPASPANARTTSVC